MKDPLAWPETDRTDLERKLLDAARSEQIPPALQLRMAKALTAPAAISGSAFSLGKLGLWGSLVALLAGAGYVGLRAPAPPKRLAAAHIAVGEAPAPQPPVAPEPPPTAAAPPAPAPRPAAAPSGDPGSRLQEELALLDRAREALRGGAHTQALALVRQHGQRFSRGTLLPEAEALRIEILMRDGDTQRAQQLAQRFLRSHPSHPLAGRVASLVAHD